MEPRAATSATADPEISAKKRDALTVTIANPDNLNALVLDDLRGLSDAWDELESDDQIRVVRRQIVRIDADQGVDLAVFSLGVQSFRVALGAGFDGTLDVDYNQVFDGIEDKTSGILAGQIGC